MLKEYVKIWDDLLKYNDRETNAKRFAIYLALDSLLLGTVLAIVSGTTSYYALAVICGTILLAHVGAYAYLVLGSSERASKVEEFLPDFLSLVASNIKAGLTPDKALIVSARSEFGPLAKAVNDAGKQSITGMPLDQVLLKVGERIRSDTLEKTIILIVEGLHSGGDLPELLEKSAFDLRKFRSVRKEVSAIILNYVMFIAAASAFGAPLLYGISTFLVEIMTRIRGRVGSGGDSLSSMGNVSMFKGKLTMTTDSVTMFASLAIIITALFGCMAIGVMSSGKRMDGLKYFPVLVGIGLAILFTVRFGLMAVLGPMLGQ